MCPAFLFCNAILHPSLKIILLVCFSILLQRMAIFPLMGALLLFVVVFLTRGRHVFRKLLGRSKWLSMTIFVVCAYATPGEYLTFEPDFMAPTYEGLNLALQQLLRLYLMLGALSLLLGTTSREQSIYGIYVLFKPMRWFQISPERFAARLWLTLHYVETSPPQTFYEAWRKGFNIDSIQSNSILTHVNLFLEH